MPKKPHSKSKVELGAQASTPPTSVPLPGAMSFDLPPEADETVNIFDIKAEAISRGRLLVMRASPIGTNKKVAYGIENHKTGNIHGITPVRKKKQENSIKKPREILKEEYDEIEIGSPDPKSKKEKRVAMTPEGTRLENTKVIASMISPQGTERSVLRFTNKTPSPLLFHKIKKGTNLDQLKEIFLEERMKEREIRTETEIKAKIAMTQSSDELFPSCDREFRGGSVTITKDDIEYRASTNKKTGGHRSLGPQPKGVMNGKTANQVAEALSLVTSKCTRWEWGHLIPAGGAPKEGFEPNLDPYNFVAIPATLNTWQMVPEMIARHMALNGFTVKYTAFARAEPNVTGKGYSFVAKEIYCAIEVEGIAWKQEFFITRELHRKPCILDASNILSAFFKIAGHPAPEDLQAQLAKELKEAEAEAKKNENSESSHTVQSPLNEETRRGFKIREPRVRPGEPKKKSERIHQRLEFGTPEKPKKPKK